MRILIFSYSIRHSVELLRWLVKFCRTAPACNVCYATLLDNPYPHLTFAYLTVLVFLIEHLLLWVIGDTICRWFVYVSLASAHISPEIKNSLKYIELVDFDKKA